MKKVFMLALVFFSLASVTLKATNPSETMFDTQKEMKEEKAANHLLIVWTSGDPDVAYKMVFMRRVMKCQPFVSPGLGAIKPSWTSHCQLSIEMEYCLPIMSSAFAQETLNLCVPG